MVGRLDAGVAGRMVTVEAHGPRIDVRIPLSLAVVRALRRVRTVIDRSAIAATARGLAVVVRIGPVPVWRHVL